MLGCSGAERTAQSGWPARFCARAAPVATSMRASLFILIVWVVFGLSVEPGGLRTRLRGPEARGGTWQARPPTRMGEIQSCLLYRRSLRVPSTQRRDETIKDRVSCCRTDLVLEERPGRAVLIRRRTSWQNTRCLEQHQVATMDGGPGLGLRSPRTPWTRTGM